LWQYRYTDELYHKAGFKYIDKIFKNGRWQYIYDQASSGVNNMARQVSNFHRRNVNAISSAYQNTAAAIANNRLARQRGRVIDRTAKDVRKVLTSKTMSEIAKASEKAQEKAAKKKERYAKAVGKSVKKIASRSAKDIKLDNGIGLAGKTKKILDKISASGNKVYKDVKNKVGNKIGMEERRRSVAAAARSDMSQFRKGVADKVSSQAIASAQKDPNNDAKYKRAIDTSDAYFEEVTKARKDQKDADIAQRIYYNTQLGKRDLRRKEKELKKKRKG